MRRFLWWSLVLLAVAAIGCSNVDETESVAGGWALKPAPRDATPVVADSKMKGIYPVGSRIADPRAFGGFGPCDNFPKNLAGRAWGDKGAVSLVAFPDEAVAYFKHCGIAVRLINRTEGVESFPACDSCLFLVREAIDGEGRWREIESLPESFCGNSFHRVSLKPDQYWEFPARRYSGPIKTKIRFRLDRENGLPPVYSREFAGQIAAAQFEEHRPERRPVHGE
jgi:hypothetical protein